MWQPIETAPKDNRRPLFLARFNDDGTIQSFDYNGSWECESESWEMPEVYYFWASENGNVEEPTHWMYQPDGFSVLPGAQTQPTPVLGAEVVSFIDTSQLEGVVSTEIVHSYPPPSGWLRAIDEALVVAHVGVADASDTYEKAKAKLDSLIGFHVDVATDPAVNGGWKLVPRPPTPTMVKAGLESSHVLNVHRVLACYDAMIDAAPEAKP